MPKRHREDISIGQDRWIDFVEIADQSYAQMVQIDEFIRRTEPFWTALEIECVAECCGIHAFSLWEEDLVNAQSKLDRQQLASTLAALHEFVRQNDADTFVSSRLNQIFHKQVLLGLIQHIQKHVEGLGS